MQFFLLFQFFMELVSKGHITRKYLAKKYELSVKTVSRYMDVLGQGGVVFESKKGVDGGYILDSNYNPIKKFFSQRELDRIAHLTTKTACEFSDDINQQILDKILGN